MAHHPPDRLTGRMTGRPKSEENEETHGYPKLHLGKSFQQFHKSMIILSLKVSSLLGHLHLHPERRKPPPIKIPVQNKSPSGQFHLPSAISHPSRSVRPPHPVPDLPSASVPSLPDQSAGSAWTRRPTPVRPTSLITGISSSSRSALMVLAGHRTTLGDTEDRRRPVRFGGQKQVSWRPEATNVTRSYYSLLLSFFRFLFSKVGDSEY